MATYKCSRCKEDTDKFLKINDDYLCPHCFKIISNRISKKVYTEAKSLNHEKTSPLDDNDKPGETAPPN